MYALSLAMIGMGQGLVSFMLLDASQPAPTDFTDIIHQIQQAVVATGQAVLQAVNDTVLSLTRVAFVSLLLLGFFLYFTHLHRRLGKDLMLGGVVLAIIAQFVIPLITRV